jgi:hypothetical protein
MRLSPTEHKIKKDLAEREIQPSKDLWDNIQLDLDKAEKPKLKYLWVKIGSLVAVLCLALLAYQNFHTTPENLPILSLESKPAIKNNIVFKPVEMAVVETTTSKNIQPEVKSSPQVTVEQKNKNATETGETLVSNIDDNEAENLSNLAVQDVETKKEQHLINEVDSLLAQAMASTEDTEQKNIINDMRAALLLAEVESDIQLEKPKHLKDKIWEALVSNLNDFTNSVVLN